MKMKIKYRVKTLIIILILIFPLSLSFSQTSPASISNASYLGVYLGMMRSDIIDENSNILITPLNKYLEIDINRRDIDPSIIEGKAIPFIEKIYFQFIRDPYASPIEVKPSGEEVYEYKLYEILIHFNEDHIGYYELQDILTNGMPEVEVPPNPKSTTGSTPPKIISYKGYGQPSSVEPQKIVWGEDDGEVKITLTRSSKINQFGNIVRLIHKTAFEYIKDLNDPKDKPASELVNFGDIQVLGTPGTNLKLEDVDIAKVGRRVLFLTALLPQD
jgi:hypothetical protein